VRAARLLARGYDGICQRCLTTWPPGFKVRPISSRTAIVSLELDHDSRGKQCTTYASCGSMQSPLSDGSSATISTQVRRETVTSDEGNLSHQRLSVCKASKHDRGIQDPQEPQENQKS